MSTHSILDPVLKDILRAITPLKEDWVVRFQIIDDLRVVVESIESLRGATVEPFGSFVSNLFTRWGDLDISIELPIGSYISSTGKKRKQMLLVELLSALKMKGGCRSLQFISNARVPILNFKSNRQGISCDISIDNLLGQMKCKVLLWINKIDDRFHDMVLLVKEWAKTHGINNSKTGTFNSYSLSLLVIFHFQTCVPAILPPLKDIYPRNMVDDLRGVRADAEKLIAETCEANISRFKSDRLRPINKSSLSQLFISFLAKFSDINSMASEMGICPYNGKWEQIQSNTRWLPKTYAIFVEDPFEQPQNTARSVSAGQLERISGVFQSTRHRLASGNLDQSSLLAELAQPRVSRFIMGPPSWNPNYSYSNNGGMYPPTRPHMQRVRQPPQQTQHRYDSQGTLSTARGPVQPSPKTQHFQNGSQGTRSNNSATTTRGSMQASAKTQELYFQKGSQGTSSNNSAKTTRGPAQQIWRQRSNT
ncbi:hypothetical protein L6164_030760 [Bauhinia variegata]|uniref:Uncharacterized protein n=1 Tax=Bauhinia variegata TaxID=167791 RepID=A0ACB9LDS1_BAUVA|nr:hypothetical protein L6164_030760 [Bauhinia variegata]